MTRFGAYAFELFALLANDHALVAVALNHDGGGHAAQIALFLVLVDDDRRGVGQLVAGQAKEFFANDLGGHEAVAAVGQFVGAVHPGLLGQVFFTDAEQALDVFGVVGRHGHELGKVMAFLHLAQPGRKVAAPVNQVKFVGQQNGRRACRQQGQHLGVGSVELAGLHHEDDQVHVVHSADHGAVERAVQGVAVAGLKTGRIHKYKLRGPDGSHAGDAVARSLGLARGDADFLPHQGVEQGGLANVGLADNRDQAAALAFGGYGRRVAGAAGHGLGQHGVERFRRLDRAQAGCSLVLRGSGFFALGHENPSEAARGQRRLSGLLSSSQAS